MYLPDLKDFRMKRVFILGDYSCAVCTDCVSNQVTQYTHVMFVSHLPENEPCFAVAAEVNASYEQGKAILANLRTRGASPEELARNARLVGSHYLGVFPGEGHRNLGASNDWADFDLFTRKALDVVAKEFSITEPPVEEPVRTKKHPPKAQVPRPNRPAKSLRKWWEFWK